MGRRIAVFSDGTGQTAVEKESEKESNVLALCRMLDLGKESGQIAIYDPGIGTHESLDGRVLPPIKLADPRPEAKPSGWQVTKEQAFGYGARENIRQLYVKLVENYSDGDQIFLFGFSRGAFTVRALAGLIHRCGLLRSQGDWRDHVDEAMSWYGKHYTALVGAERAGYRAQVDAFRRKYCVPCNVEFLGVWDTVKSVGYLSPVNLPHVRHNPIVRHVRHALAIDERRSFYQITTWGGLSGKERPAVSAPASFDLDETDYPQGSPQDVKEVWFPGNHRDVGGGYADHQQASRNALRWMVHEAHDCGLEFDADRYRETFPLGRDEPVAIDGLHDEMKGAVKKRAGWWMADHIPRKELQNEPPPPTTIARLKPSGRRKLETSARPRLDGSGASISIHESARGVYAAGSEPWRGLPVQFVATGPFINRPDVTRPVR